MALGVTPPIQTKLFENRFNEFRQRARFPGRNDEILWAWLLQHHPLRSRFLCLDE